MRNRRRNISIIPATGHEVNRIKVELYYNEGGMSYATYQQEERGYYLIVLPEFYQDEGNGFCSTKTSAFSGIKQLIEPAKRFGQKKLDNFTVDQEVIDRLVNYVANKNSLTITKEPLAA